MGGPAFRRLLDQWLREPDGLFDAADCVQPPVRFCGRESPWTRFAKGEVEPDFALHVHLRLRARTRERQAGDYCARFNRVAATKAELRTDEFSIRVAPFDRPLE